MDAHRTGYKKGIGIRCPECGGSHLCFVEKMPDGTYAIRLPCRSAKCKKKIQTISESEIKSLLLKAQ